ncbi:hypothetical protein MRX96_034495 [Rhipicephalus microplus]
MCRRLCCEESRAGAPRLVTLRMHTPTQDCSALARLRRREQREHMCASRARYSEPGRPAPPRKLGRRSRARDGRQASLAAIRSRPLQHRFGSAL